MHRIMLFCCCSKKDEEDDSFNKSPGFTGIPGQKPTAVISIPSKTLVSQGPVFSEGTLESKYDVLQPLGTGSTSICHLCRNPKTGTDFACKVIDKRTVQSRFKGLLQQFQIEIEVLQMLDHPNIIKLVDVYETDDKIYMISELMRGGELFDYIVEKGTLSELEASRMVREITSAVAYMHSCGIIHRDLKPENLLLTSKNPNATLKLIDFGLAKMLHNSETKSFLGTRGYLAPEILRREAYSKSVDVWALGVIIYVLLCGCLPFDDDGSEISSVEAAKVKFGLRFPRWANNLSESAKDLLRHVLDIDPTRRFTAEQALNHPWVAGKEATKKLLESPRHLRRITKTPKRENENNQRKGTKKPTSKANHIRQEAIEEEREDLNARRQSIS